MNKAIFLDRDGVLNKDNPDYTYRVEDFKILDGVYEALKIWQQKQYKLIVISNQAGIGRNIYRHQNVEQIHSFMINKLLENGIHLTEIYYCPHHPESGNCICRKPDSLLLEKAIARFNINAAQSYFIGDRDRDVQAGEKAGVNAIKVDTDVDLTSILHLIV